MKNISAVIAKCAPNMKRDPVIWMGVNVEDLINDTRKLRSDLRIIPISRKRLDEVDLAILAA